MTEIEQLRADKATLEAAVSALERYNWTSDICDIAAQNICVKLAALEAEEAKKEKVNRWREAKSIFDEWEQSFKGFRCTPAVATEYVRHLEAEVQRLEAELARRPDHGPWVVIPADQDRIEILGRMHQYREYVFPRYADALNHRAKAYTPSDYKIVLLSDVFYTGEQR